MRIKSIYDRGRHMVNPDSPFHGHPQLAGATPKCARVIIFQNSPHQLKAIGLWDEHKEPRGGPVGGSTCPWTTRKPKLVIGPHHVLHRRTKLFARKPDGNGSRIGELRY